MPTWRTSVDLSWSGASGSPGVNVFHGRSAGGDPQLDIDEQSGWIQDFYDTIKGSYNNDVSIRHSGEWFGVGDDEGTMWQSDPWSITGTGGTDHLAPALCILVQWRAATGGRSGRGRTFLGPLQDASSESNGTPDESSRAGIEGAANALVAASVGSSNGALGIWSRVDGVFRDVTSATVPNYFAVLRSRRD